METNKSKGPKTMPTRSLRFLLLPLLLTAVSLIVLFTDPAGEMQVRVSRAKEERWQESEIIAARIKEQSLPSYWADQASWRILGPFGDLPRVPSSDEAVELLLKGRASVTRDFGATCKMWAILIKPDGAWEPVRHQKLETKGRSILTRFLGRLAEISSQPMEKRENSIWESRMNKLFGPGIHPKFFRPMSQGVAWGGVWEK